jgi:hypothetical protein
MSELTHDQITDVLNDATEEELGVGLFTGKLYQLNRAGVDLGITVENLCMLLVAINVTYDEYIAPGEGAPN